MASNTLVEKLVAAIEQEYAPSILLSGGMDSSSILALAVAELGKRPVAVTVSLQERGQDLKWAEEVTKHLGTPWYPQRVEPEQAIEEGLPALVRINRSFDLGILNDLPYFFAMQQLLKQDIASGMTGDGGDWLFGGYQFLWDKKEQYNGYVADALPHIEWTSSTIGNQLDLTIRQPFLTPEFVAYALAIPFSDKVKRIESERYGDVAVDVLGTSSHFDEEGTSGKLWGKVSLREAMVGYLPSEVLWRPKTDLEFGPGMSTLSPELEKRISDEQYQQIQARTGINFWGGKAQAYLFLLYESEVGDIPSPSEDERACSGCNAGVPIQRRHCKTCGYFEETLPKG